MSKQKKLSYTLLFFMSVFIQNIEGKVYFALCEEGYVPIPQIHHNDVSIISALYEANGEEWVVKNVFLDSRLTTLGFGDNNLIILCCGSTRYNFLTPLEYLKGIKKGIDRLSERGDTLYLYPFFMTAYDVESLSTDKKKRMEFLNRYYAHNLDEFNKYNWMIRLKYAMTENDNSNICIEMKLLSKRCRIYSSVIRNEYKEVCESLHRKYIYNPLPLGEYTYSDCALFLKYFLEERKFRCEDMDRMKYLILPITYSNNNDTLFEKVIRPANHNTKKNVEECHSSCTIEFILIPIVIILIVACLIRYHKKKLK